MLRLFALHLFQLSKEKRIIANVVIMKFMPLTSWIGVYRIYVHLTSRVEPLEWLVGCLVTFLRICPSESLQWCFKDICPPIFTTRQKKKKKILWWGLMLKESMEIWKHKKEVENLETILNFEFLILLYIRGL